jgi:hypothetical protein
MTDKTPMSPVADRAAFEAELAALRFRARRTPGPHR